MKFVSIEGVKDYDLRMHAMRRGYVKMRDGRIAKLVSWPGNQRRRGRYCRLETGMGTRFTLKCEMVEAMAVGDVE
jgi:hypothetical protein